MAALNSFQKITRVLPGMPFGSGADGALTISSNTTQSLTIKSCSGSSGSTTLTIASGDFTNGDVVIIHQTRGTGAGQWEVNRVSSGGGTTSLTLQVALNYTYTDSGASQAQVFKLPMYTTVVVNGSTTWSATDWDANINGFLAFAVNVSATITGNLSSQGKGFVAGAAVASGVAGNQGESTTGAGSASTSANGMAGGGGNYATNNQRQGGGGGGYATAGTTGGTLGGGSPTPGAGGGTGGAADLTTLIFGGSGGSGSGESGTDGGGAGGDSGGGIFIFAKDITITGTINGKGSDGPAATGSGAGGGGAGGSILLEVGSATLGSNLMTATGGAGGDGNSTADGGAAGTGRIAIHHSGTVSGTSNPTFTDTTDSTLVETGGGFIQNLI